jgi:hypothetical protein
LEVLGVKTEVEDHLYLDLQYLALSLLTEVELLANQVVLVVELIIQGLLLLDLVLRVKEMPAAPLQEMQIIHH